jgi:hypothetical protein
MYPSRRCIVGYAPYLLTTLLEYLIASSETFVFHYCFTLLMQFRGFGNIPQKG